MDGITLFRSLLTLVLLVAFIGLVFWAWSSKRKTDFDEAANLPFTDDNAPAVANGGRKEEGS